MRAVILTILMFSRIAHAGLFRLESETLTSARNDEMMAFELPSYEFLSANYQSFARDFEFNADLAVFGEPYRSRNDFKLHLLNFSYAPLPETCRINVGRDYDVQRSIRTQTVDTVGLDLFFFDKRVQTGAFAGKEQRIELSQWTPTSTIAGGYLSFTSSSMLPLFAKVKYQHRTYERATSRDEDLVQFSAQKSFSGALNPEFLVDSETNLNAKHLNRFESGFDLYPDYKTALRIRVLSFDLKPLDGLEQPIFSIFSQGRLYEASLQAERQLTSSLTVSLSGAYDSYVVQDPKRTTGHKVESDVKYRLENFTFYNSFYYLNSFGGNVLGGRAIFSQKLSDRTELNEAVDLAFYHKITSSKRPAFSCQAIVHETLTNRIKLSVGAELNSNNNLRYDARGVAKLTYLLWTET